MIEQISYGQWLLARWKSILALALTAGFILGVTALSVTSWSSREYSVQAMWPARLSADSGSKLPVALDAWQQDLDLSGTATLFHGTIPDGLDAPEAFDAGVFTQLAEAAVDAEGLTVLDVPPVSRNPDADRASTLLLRLRVDGGERWFEHQLEEVDAPVLALSFDRPLYQPGQTIKLRGLAASATTGHPLDTKIRFVVRDARSNLVLDEEVQSGPNGVAATELALADRCVQGQYTVEMSADGESKTSYVDVRPFRLPRFKVEVETLTPLAEPGEVLKARVKAMYTYGGPVADAEVSVEASAGPLNLPGITGKTDAAGGLDLEFALPRNAPAAAAINIAATVTSVAGRAEVGNGTAQVAGRSARVELVPARSSTFVYGRSQTAYVIVTQPDGSPIAGAAVDLVLPEASGERTARLETDAKGRAAFHWSPDAEIGNYASVEVRHNGVVLFRQNVHPGIGYQTEAMQVNESVTDVGATVRVELTPSAESRIVTLSRDGVTLSAAAVQPQGTEAMLEVPAAAAGFANIALLRGAGVDQHLPIWVRQKGGDRVQISLDRPDYRPGTQATVSLSFPPGTPRGDEPPVTFGLVGVDEALYALKERASVPLYVLMRRSPTSIGAALEAFDGVDSDDAAGIDIATHRFRSRLNGFAPSSSGYGELSDQFDRFERSGRVKFFFVLWLLALTAVLAQMVRWTWSVASKDAFTWRRAFAQLGFGVFCGLFAAVLGAASSESWLGGMSVWQVVVGCWVVAAAARLPELPLTRWLAAHVLGVAVFAAIGICVQDLGESNFAGWVLGVGMAVPAILIAAQWLVWAFVMMREGLTKPGLGVGSFAGILTIGLGGFMMIGGATRYEMAPMAQMSAGMREEAMDFAPAKSAPAPVLAELAPGRAAGGAPAADQGPRVRSWFPETMVWLPEIAADATGSASVNVEIPDSITTWRLDAWANSADGRFGQGQAPLLAIQPYFVELDVPVEVTDGDRFEVPITLVNRSESPLTVEVRAEAEGPLSLRGTNGGASRLEAGARTTLWLNVAAVGSGDGAITVRSTTDGADAQDAVRRPLRVRPDGRLLRTSASGIVGKGWEAPVNVPPGAIANTTFGEVRLFGSLVADALAGLDSMLAYPTGCFEQTSSANYPNVMVLRAMRDMKPADWPDGPDEFRKVHGQATKLVRIGYQRMLAFQKPDGGFALYPERYESDTMLTAYGILQLVWAQDVTSVDPAVIERAASWLVRQQREDGSWTGRKNVSGSVAHESDIGLARSTAFIVMALSATKNANYRSNIDRALVRLEDRMGSIESANALAFVANALADAGSKELALKAVDRLAGMATREGQIAYWADPHPTWMGGMSRYAARETTALATQALLTTESQADLLQPTLNWIANNRGGWGGWGSTQATVWTLRTLETLRAKSSADATLRFYFDSQQLPTVAGAKELQVTSSPQPLRQFSFVPAADEGRFLVDASAETTAMVQLVTEYAVDWDSRWAEVDDEPFGGEVELQTRATARGATTRAYARIENLFETDATMVIVEVPLPPGAFVPTDALDDLVRNGAVDLYEVLPTHIRFYVDSVPGKQERVFAYDFVPLVRGTFSLPPLRAYPFYSPEPVTEVDAGDVRTE